MRREQAGRVPLRIAVVGAGRMGTNHARVLDGLPDAVLAGVFDASSEAATRLAAQYGVPAFTDLGELVANADAAVVAASSSVHAEVGTALLDRGLPCLIEKPFATTGAECDRLIDAATRAGVRIAVGHVERFNPAVAAARQALDGAEILAIEGRRLNPGSGRILDVDVVLDLMLHDIDTVLYLMGAEPVRIAAQGVAVGQSGLADHASVLLGFPSGAVASLTASRISETRVRSLSVFCRDRTILLDYLAQEVRVARGDGEELLPVEKAQPLARELEAFIDGIRDDGLPIGVGAVESLKTLRVVWAAQAQLSEATAG